MYKSINRLKKENMDFQTYCLLKSLMDSIKDSKPNRYRSIPLIILKQKVYAFSGAGEIHAKMYM